MQGQTKYLNNEDNDSVLWNNLREGNERAFSVLFEKYYSTLIRYGNLFSVNKTKVQDCVQDVFTDLWIYREKLSCAIVVKAYLLSSVRNRITRVQQRDRIFNKIEKIETIDSVPFLLEFSIENHLIADEEIVEKVTRLNKLLNNLPSRQKEALYLRYHQNLSIEQIADTLKINYQSANNKVSRALLNLRKEWMENFSLFLVLSTTLF